MSKQSEAKKAQGYRINAPRCGNCRHFLSDTAPIEWMVRMNDEQVSNGRAAAYDLDLPQNRREVNLRCGIGKFAVKKTAHCLHWEGGNE